MVTTNGVGVRKTPSSSVREVEYCPRRAELDEIFAQMAIDSIDESIIVTSAELDPPGPRIEYVNAGFTAMTGYVASEVIGRTPRLLQGPATNRASLDKVRAALMLGRPFAGETVNYRKNGTSYVVEWLIKPAYGPDGGIRQWVSTQRDVTRRRELESQLVENEIRLRESEARLARAVAAAKMSTWEWDVATSTFSFSAGWEELHGRSAGSMPTLASTLETLHPDDRAMGMQARERVMQGGLDEFAVEFRVVFPDGSTHWLLSTGKAERDNSHTLVRLTGITQDITERHEAEQRITYLARFDGLTGLANRDTLQERLASSLEQSKRRSGCAVLALDLDGFKDVNDTLGHAAGDELLRSVAGRLRATVRGVDMVARPGGDEFVIIQPDVRASSETEALAGRITKELSRPHEIDGGPVSISVSIGIALAPSDGTAVEQVLRSADLALYEAKQKSGSCYCFFEAGLQERAEKRRQLDADLRQALARSEFELHFQPLVHLPDRQIVGFEALLRWRHPVQGLLSPQSFMAVAEETGLIEPIGNWVLRRACAEAKSWPEQLRLAVNLSARQFASGRLPEIVAGALSDAGLKPARLELEITETLMLRDTDDTINTLHLLRAQGVRIAMDDFGTGYSSLSYCTKFPFDRIKIDRAFVAGSSDKRGAAIICAIVNLCGGLDIAVTAEGIETAEHLQRVVDLGCHEGQGFLFAHPCSAQDIPSLLKEWRSAPARTMTASLVGAPSAI